MRLLAFALVLISQSVLTAGWEDVQRIPVNEKVEVTTGNGTVLRAAFHSASGQAMTVENKTGEQSISRTEVRRVRVRDPGRRMRNGLIWTAVGAGAGAGIGWAVCVYCANEGSGSKFVAPLTAIGAGIGALGFLPAPYRTVYRSK